MRIWKAPGLVFSGVWEATLFGVAEFPNIRLPATAYGLVLPLMMGAMGLLILVSFGVEL